MSIDFLLWNKCTINYSEFTLLMDLSTYIYFSQLFIICMFSDGEVHGTNIKYNTINMRDFFCNTLDDSVILQHIKAGDMFLLLEMLGVGQKKQVLGHVKLFMFQYVCLGSKSGVAHSYSSGCGNGWFWLWRSPLSCFLMTKSETVQISVV